MEKLSEEEKAKLSEKIQEMDDKRLERTLEIARMADETSAQIKNNLISFIIRLGLPVVLIIVTLVKELDYISVICSILALPGIVLGFYLIKKGHEAIGMLIFIAILFVFACLAFQQS